MPDRTNETLVLDELDTGELDNAYGYSPARQSNKYRKEMTIFVNRLAPKDKGAAGVVAQDLLIEGSSLPPSDCFVPGRLSFYGITAARI